MNDPDGQRQEPTDARPPAEVDAQAAQDDTALAEEEGGDELDGLRIRQLAAIRRGAFRARSYALIVTAACLVVAIQLLVMTAETVGTRGWSLSPIGYALFAIVALLLATHFGRRVRELSRELRTPAPLPPPPPGGPDFSTLSDGSQQWKNLEDMR